MSPSFRNGRVRGAAGLANGKRKIVSCSRAGKMTLGTSQAAVAFTRAQHSQVWKYSRKAVAPAA